MEIRATLETKQVVEEAPDNSRPGEGQQRTGWEERVRSVNQGDADQENDLEHRFDNVEEQGIRKDIMVVGGKPRSWFCPSLTDLTLMDGLFEGTIF